MALSLDNLVNQYQDVVALGEGCLPNANKFKTNISNHFCMYHKFSCLEFASDEELVLKRPLIFSEVMIEPATGALPLSF